ncbi:hypothetical protein SAMN02927916_3108 [Flavobacterium anhuiense]|uniref:Uncharacterized protein n=1 Tax=Flavobacterium anhuiense TaxID=459526 RepID=A0ABY0LYC7_9FLAO|nr:hypothetical protein [Flavobacterium anhuiense]SCY73760.1 hypothetical protein SAMN02927916_3108 [Flavobacterium anhuiense]
MEVSIGFSTLIFILFFIVFPGFIARRFYFNGEFSKQITSSISSILNLIYSFFIGIILSLGFILIINFFRKKNVDIDQIIEKFYSNFVIEPSDLSSTNKFKGFSSTVYNGFLPYIGGVYIFAAVIGLFASKMILFFGVDTKWKFFRYGNNWHYLFSGKILKFKHHFSSDFNHKLKVKYTYLDILVSEKGEETTLYSGFFADYDICANDISKLERVYLLKATRYKKTEEGVITRNIPGNLFTIMGDRILNINCTYVCFSEDESKYKSFINRRNILISAQILTTISFIAIAICILFSLRLTDNIYFNKILTFSFFEKIIILFLLNIFIGLLTPFKIDSQNHKINFNGFENYLTKIIIILLFSGFYFYVFPFISNIITNYFN